MKKFYKENRVFVILMGIALVCIAIIVALLAGYVLRSTTGDKYGNRLDGIKDVIIEDEKKDDMESKILEMAKVQDVVINIHGKIINFNVEFQDDTTVAEAQNVAVNCLSFFEEDYLNYYELQFLFKKSDDNSEVAFPMLGYRKAQSSTISWSNNTKK